MSYAGLLNKYWIGPFSGKPLASITAPDIKRIFSAHSVSNKTKKNALAVLSSIMAHAEIHPNPCRQVKIRRNQKAPIERYTNLNVKRSWAPWRAIIRFSLPSCLAVVSGRGKPWH